MSRTLLAALILLLPACPPPDEVTSPEERVRLARQLALPMMAVDLAARDLEVGDPVFIRILKEERELELWMKGNGSFDLFRTYRICRLSGELGPKLREGDRQAPEGFYFVDANRLNPDSEYHLAFNIGYPNEYDRAHGRTGSAIMVHGDCVSIGCYAMTDPIIEQIYTLVHAALENGQPFIRVHVFPFRMTDANLRRHADSEWRDFWENLREGYDLFEGHHVPPDARVENLRYVFVSGADSSGS